jgi:hypothetical protein
VLPPGLTAWRAGRVSFCCFCHCCVPPFVRRPHVQRGVYGLKAEKGREYTIRRRPDRYMAVGLPARLRGTRVLTDRFTIAKKYLDDARFLLDAGRLDSAVSRAYYAAYQAMWAALESPPRGGQWRHLGIISHFVRGY